MGARDPMWFVEKMFNVRNGTLTDDHVKILREIANQFKYSNIKKLRNGKSRYKISVTSKTNNLLNILSSLDDNISMSPSQKIAELNYTRFQNFTTLPEKQALYAYNGDVYNNIDTKTLDDASIKFSQKHLRILSALYGLLKPLDMIRAYRLEMSSKLKEIALKGMNLFWKDHITNNLNSELKTHDNKFLINIASNEYSASVDPKSLEASIINIHFRENRNNELRNIANN